MAQNANLQPFELDGIPIKFRGCPTLVDGKTRVLWQDWIEKKSFGNCGVCGAPPTEMAKRHGHFRTNQSALLFGPSTCHCRVRGFEFFCKTRLHSDVQNWQCRKEQRHLYDAQMAALQSEFKERLGLIVYRPKSKGR